MVYICTNPDVQELHSVGARKKAEPFLVHAETMNTDMQTALPLPGELPVDCLDYIGGKVTPRVNIGGWYGRDWPRANRGLTVHSSLALLFLLLTTAIC